MSRSVLDAARWTARWDDLPEAARARLRACIRGPGAPAPLHVDAVAHIGRSSLGPRMLAGAALVVLVAVAAVRFGDPAHPREGIAIAVLLAALAWAFVFALLLSRRRALDTGIPRGRYVFPTDVIAIDDDVISVLPLAAIRSVWVEDATVALELGGGAMPETLTAPRAEVRAAIVRAVEDVRAAVEARDAASLFDVDVLAPARGDRIERQSGGDGAGPYRSSRRDGTERARTRTGVARIAALALPAVLVGGLGWAARNELSDRWAVAALHQDAAHHLSTTVDPSAMMERARVLGQARAYVAGDGASEDEVRRIVARLALVTAEERGTEGGWHAVLADVDEGPEADRARREIARYERIRLQPFVRSDLPPEHAAVLTALGRAVIDNEPLALVIAVSSGTPDASRLERDFASSVQRELERREELRGVRIEVGEPARADLPRLHVTWSVGASDGAEIAEIALTARGLRWTSTVGASDAVDELAAAVALAVLPPRR